MAATMNKRRKMRHDPSDDESDDASFASFSDDGDHENDTAGEIEVDQYESAEDVNEDGDSEEANDDDEEQDHNSRASTQHKPHNVSIQADKKQSQGQHHAKRVESRANSALTSGAFKSTMFKIQTDDLLEQIRPKYSKRGAAAEEALHKVKKAIEQIPERSPLPVEEAERQLLSSHQVVVPFPDSRPPKNAQYKLEYKKPANINVVGSHALKTASRSNANLEIDMSITMPSSIFQEKDYLNHRYFYKRAYYIACIAVGLGKLGDGGYRVEFQSLHDNDLKPIITVTPTDRTLKWKINVIPCVASDTFQADKLLPARNAVRQQSGASSTAAASETEASPTPFYNSSITSDMLTSAYLKLLHSTSKKCAAFQDACLLGSTWLRQRGLGSNVAAGGFGNFELCALMALLVEGGGPRNRPILSEGYSSYQLWKATLQLLAMKDLIRETLVIGDADGASLRVPGVPVLWDDERKHNILFKMTSWSYKVLRYEARSTLSMLADHLFDGFEAAFVRRSDSLLYRYDYVLQLPLSAIGVSAQPGQGIPAQYTKLHATLARALGDRANLINLIQPELKSWPTNFAEPTSGPNHSLLVGVIVNPEHVNRAIDHGPSAENKVETASFRAFWGDKAELRRFKDGSILETLAWADKASEKSIFEQIVRYVVKKHVGLDAERQLVVSGDGFRKLLRRPTGLEAQDWTKAYQQLESHIRSLDDLPLSVRSITPADAQLRHASLVATSNAPAHVVVQLEGSARWPDDLVAIQRTKIAFLLNLAGLLQQSVDGISARVGLENHEHDVLNQGFLDVVYDSGAPFRLRIHHDREQTLFERTLKDKTLEPRSKEVAALGLAKYKRDYVKAPAFTQSIASLCSRHPPLSGTIQLLKRWFASHLLANHFADEVIEMFAARTFVQPWPWQAPSSVQAGFLRTLSWLSRWDWHEEPLIVDLSGAREISQAQLQSIQTKFDAWRKLDPLLNRVALFCASNVDLDGTAWSDGQPQKVVAARMTALARAACAEIDDKELQLEPLSLFSSPLVDYDFAIHLNPRFASGQARSRGAKTNGSGFKNLELDVNGDASTRGYDPAADFLKELERQYDTAILFFSGGHIRPIIAGLWHPQTAQRAWKLNLAYSTIPKRRPDADEVQADVNKEAILAEIARIGGDMIDKIEVRP